jgi:GntR family transcriptional regulator/MocR family aminotransferase
MKRSAFIPPITLDARQERPLYRQLYDWFRAAVIEGKMRPGQRLPSSRSMAIELGISRISVVTAYDQLLSEGYLETFVGSGTCVARTIPEEALAPTPPGTRVSQQAVSKSTRRRISTRASALPTAGSEPWLQHRGTFRVSMPALDEFPVNLWSKLVARHTRKLSLGLMAYGDPLGYLPFRKAIADYLGTFRGVRCDASQVLVTTGSQQGLQMSAQVLMDPGDRVIMEDPGYPGARLAFISSGAKVVGVPVDDEGLVVSKIEGPHRQARVVYVTPSHQYPLGMTMSAARRMSLLNWARSTNSWIIEDDYDSEYRFDGRPIASLQGLDTHGRVIYIGTFSKVLFPALRLGYMIVPRDLVPVFAAVRDATDIFTSTPYQAILADFIGQGHFARHIRRMRMLYMERRKALLNAIQREMGSILEVIGAQAGMHLVGLLPPGLKDELVSKQAARNGISAMPLSICYLKSPSRGGLILGYGGATARQMNDGMRKLKLCLSHYEHE